jgi:MFS family permease
LGLQDSVTITFLLPNITNSLNSLRHISFYLGFYRITAGVARPYAEAFSQKSPQTVLFLSLLLLQVGWVLCGLSTHSWLFVAGRSLLGAGSAGVISSSKVLEPLLTAKEVHADGVFYSKVLTMAEWVSCLVGPLLVLLGKSVSFSADNLLVSGAHLPII